MPNTQKVDINYPREKYNSPAETETSMRPRESMFSRLRELGELAQLMGDDVALDAKKMTQEQMEAQEEWVEACQRTEAEDAFALQNADDIDSQTMTPEEILMAKEALRSNGTDEEYVN